MGTSRPNTGSRSDIAVLAPVGELDFSTLGPLRGELTDALEAGNRIIIDLTGLAFADSSVLGLLAGSAVRARDAGGWVRLVAPQRSIARMLEVTALDSVLSSFESVDAAATT